MRGRISWAEIVCSHGVTQKCDGKNVEACLLNEGKMLFPTDNSRDGASRGDGLHERLPRHQPSSLKVLKAGHDRTDLIESKAV